MSNNDSVYHVGDTVDILHTNKAGALVRTAKIKSVKQSSKLKGNAEKTIYTVKIDGIKGYRVYTETGLKKIIQ